ncbi:MAG: hypothetical protein ACI8RZ_004652 [Myxococcota bacterium]|jgi:hypothetical protein
MSVLYNNLDIGDAGVFVVVLDMMEGQGEGLCLNRRKHQRLTPRPKLGGWLPGVALRADLHRESVRHPVVLKLIVALVAPQPRPHALSRYRYTICHFGFYLSGVLQSEEPTFHRCR